MGAGCSEIIKKNPNSDGGTYTANCFFIRFFMFTSTLVVVCLAYGVQIFFQLWDGGNPILVRT